MHTNLSLLLLYTIFSVGVIAFRMIDSRFVKKNKLALLLDNASSGRNSASVTLFFLLGFWGLIGSVSYGYSLLHKKSVADDVAAWRSTNAKVTDLAVKEIVSVSLGKGGGGLFNHEFVPKLRYEFTVDDVVYDGHAISLTNASHSYDSIDTIHERYSVGNMVTAYYDPQSPSECCLSCAPEANGMMQSIVAMAAFGIGIAWFVIALRSRKTVASPRGSTSNDAGSSGAKAALGISLTLLAVIAAQFSLIQYEVSGNLIWMIFAAMVILALGITVIALALSSEVIVPDRRIDNILRETHIDDR